MADASEKTIPDMPSLEELQHWTWIIGRAQQMVMEAMSQADGGDGKKLATLFFDPNRAAEVQNAFWNDSIRLWQRFLAPPAPDTAPANPADKDRRFAAPQWRDNPVFDLIRQTYLMLCEHLLSSVDAISGVDARQREQIRFVTRLFADAMSPSNFPLTNPQVLEKTIETRGENLLKGLEYMLADLGKGQLTQTDPNAFELGRNIAATPGKVVRETPLYQLIQYAPTSETVFETPLVIFPPWINRYYILDLSPQKSFIRWAVEQGLTVFVVSWKSADASMADITADDYVLRGQVDAIDAVRELLGVEGVHAIGYCVAGTTLAMTLALLAARGEAQKVKSATFFTAQVDFAGAGDLNLFVDDDQMKLISMLTSEGAYLDGRYMAATFNLLRGRDLIWSYVVNNYLLGQEYPPFDLLHWNGDYTNLPAKWHRAYLEDLYRDNKLVQPGGVTIDGTPIDLSRVETPSYIQAGREDHIAPAESVWKLMHHLAGPKRFVLAGSGHIAGVVNPPSAKKYQYWTNPGNHRTLQEFVAGAKEVAGSWWPDWIQWIEDQASARVVAENARIPGNGAFPAIEDAPGRYVRTR
ncbi:PHA/PHB synthase family protein [Flavisphingomonas formosensis]|uniref:PHA/PHB synthase family protein n=1 Tax=Flavisphingomonas formosensis TaxID=861534 RepID=UPI0012FCDB42|nr:class I poly(R)-hydroxyalkanoic acid synthase [Sphingomonas formosensis]